MRKLIIGMKIYIKITLILSLLTASEPIFGEREDYGEIEYPSIDEASGIASSKKNNNVFWTHNDSGDENRIFALNQLGEHLGIYYLDNCDARDWEDIAIGPGPEIDEFYIYVGEIGDNNSQYDTKYIYRFIEPEVYENQSPVTEIIYNIDTIEFQYEDGSRDAETIMIDPITKDIIIISKREESIHAYQLPYPQNLVGIQSADLIKIIDFYPEETTDSQRIVAGDISSDGSEILIKSYIDILHFPRYNNETISNALDNTMTLVEYIIEPQGEAVGWHPDGFGYYTISEESNNIPSHLYFYPRIVGCMDDNSTNYNPYALEEDGGCLYDTLIGDFNNDDNTDILDIVILVEGILNLTTEELDGTDINNDGDTNILDVIQLINLILS